jgi:hypothetical protein
VPEIRNISISYREYQDRSELSPEDQELIIASEEAARSAYAPYSLFRVGAAIRLESGRIVQGANVENSAFPSGFVPKERHFLPQLLISRLTDLLQLQLQQFLIRDLVQIL